MKKQINEIKRMQELAGIINEGFSIDRQWPSEVPSRYGEYIFKLVNVMPDGAKYDVIDAETGKKELGGRAYRSVETLKNAAADLVKPKGGTQSTQLEENANIPENIMQFAKKKGITSEVNKIAKWVDQAGKRIVGGTAIGKDYNTLILDLTHQGSEIYYNIGNDTITVHDQPVSSYEQFLNAIQSNSDAWQDLKEKTDQGIRTVRSFSQGDSDIPSQLRDQAYEAVRDNLTYIKQQGYNVDKTMALYFPNFTWAAKNYGPATGLLVGSDTIVVTPVQSQKIYKISDSMIANKIAKGDLQAYTLYLA